MNSLALHNTSQYDAPVQRTALFKILKNPTVTMQPDNHQEYSLNTDNNHL